MSYAAVATARADTALITKIALALTKEAAIRIVDLTVGGDQRERQVCNLIAAGPPEWMVDMVLLLLDMTGGVTVGNPTDAQIDTAIDTLWARLVALVA